MNIFYLHQPPGRTAFINEKEYLFFSGYSYLGMQQLPEFAALIKEGIDKYGWLFPSSRISNTQLSLFSKCEALLSSITGMEDTVLVSSGYLAGKLATALWENNIENLSPSHPAIQGINDMSTATEIFAVDSVDVLTGKVTDLSVFDAYEPKVIIIDDSHGIGLLGKEGEGISSKLTRRENIDYVLSYSLSKAWNINGGAVSCSKKIANNLRSLPEYAAATAPSPALLHAFINGRHLYKMQHQKLRNNIQYFQALLQGLPVSHHSELPVFILPASFDEQRLIEKNIIISSFAYPDPSGIKQQRIVLNGLHTFHDLEYLANVLHKIMQ